MAAGAVVVLRQGPAAKEAYEGFEVLVPDDVADAILYALDTPWRVNIGCIELTPTEQYAGGVAIVPVEKGQGDEAE